MSKIRPSLADNSKAEIKNNEFNQFKLSQKTKDHLTLWAHNFQKNQNPAHVDIIRSNVLDQIETHREAIAENPQLKVIYLVKSKVLGIEDQFLESLGDNKNSVLDLNDLIENKNAGK